MARTSASPSPAPPSCRERESSTGKRARKSAGGAIPGCRVPGRQPRFGTIPHPVARDVYNAAGRAILDGIFHQIAYRLPEQLCIPARVQGAASTKMVMLRASAWGRPGPRRSGSAGRRRAALRGMPAPDWSAPRVRSPWRTSGPPPPRQSGAAPVWPGAEVLLFAEQADSGLQDCQRCAEFMGRAAGEVPLHDEDLVQPLGHLIERQGQCGRLIPLSGISTAAPDPQPSAPGSGK